MPKTKRNRSTAGTNYSLKWIPLFVFSLILTAGIAVGLCALLAKAMCKTDLEPSLLIPLTTAFLCVAVLLASLFLASFGKGKIWSGSALALLLILVLSAWSFAVYQTSFTELWITKAVAILASGTLGGYLGALMRERRRKIRR